MRAKRAIIAPQKTRRFARLAQIPIRSLALSQGRLFAARKTLARNDKAFWFYKFCLEKG